MTTANHGGRSADQMGTAQAWEDLARGLASAIDTLTAPDQSDHLSIELPETDESAATPYAQFCGFREGDDGDGIRMIRAEISGNPFLVPAFQLGPEGCAYLADHGWSGNQDVADENERNWFAEVPIGRGSEVAEQVVTVMRDHFGVAHPQLLVFRSWGPAAEVHDHRAMLGLTRAEDVPSDEPQPAPGADVMFPQSPDELRELARDILGDRFGDIDTDDDGDLLLWHMGQRVCIYVASEMPDLVISARVAHGVHSRRAAAVELSILNRDQLWTKWFLRDRDVWQTSALHAHPLVPNQLIEGVELFLGSMTATRDDLVLRTGAEVG